MTQRVSAIQRVTLAGSFANFALLILKFIAGFLGRSGAMLADAVHSLTDFLTDILVLVFVRLSSKPRDRDHEWGHGKFETLATVIIGSSLAVVGIGIAVKSVGQIAGIFKGVMPEMPGKIALYAAAISIVVKEILFQVTRSVARRVNSPATEANAWHHRSDAMSSVGTFLGIGGAILLGDKWVVLDPLAALVVSFFIVRVSVQLVMPGLDDLLEKSLPEDVEKEITDIIMEDPSVSDPHNLRTRKIGPYFAVEVHVRMDGGMTVAQSHAVTKSIEDRIRARYGSEIHIIIHVEPVK